MNAYGRVRLSGYSRGKAEPYPYYTRSALLSHTPRDLRFIPLFLTGRTIANPPVKLLE